MGLQGSKISGSRYNNKIYSKETGFRMYKLKQFRHFGVGDKAHPEAVTLEDVELFVDEYLRHLIELELVCLLTLQPQRLQ